MSCIGALFLPIVSPPGIDICWLNSKNALETREVIVDVFGDNLDQGFCWQLIGQRANEQPRSTGITAYLGRFNCIAKPLKIVRPRWCVSRQENIAEQDVLFRASFEFIPRLAG